jgi:hypothetical protein
MLKPTWRAEQKGQLPSLPGYRFLVVLLAGEVGEVMEDHEALDSPCCKCARRVSLGNHGVFGHNSHRATAHLHALPEKHTLPDAGLEILDAHLSNYRCVHCDFSLPRGWGGYVYVEDGSGKRIPCSHPGEEQDVRRALGHHFNESFKAVFPSFWAFRRAGVPGKYLAEQKLIFERVGFNPHCVCTSCLHQFEADLVGGSNPGRSFNAVA